MQAPPGLELFRPGTSASRWLTILRDSPPCNPFRPAPVRIIREQRVQGLVQGKQAPSLVLQGVAQAARSALDPLM